MLNRLEAARGEQKAISLEGGLNGVNLQPFEDVKTGISKIKQYSTSISDLRQRYIKEANIRSYNSITNEYQKLLDLGYSEGRSIKEKLLNIKSYIENVQDSGNTATKQLLQNNLNSTNKLFHDSWQRFQSVSEEFRESVKTRMGRQARIVKPDVTEDEINKLVAEGPKEFFSKQMLIGDPVLDKIAEIEETHEKMQRIESSMREVLTLFQDFQTVITLQQESLDVIDHHIELTTQYAKEGKKELVAAREYQKKTRSKYCWLFVCLLVLLVVLAAIFGILGGMKKL